MDERKPRFRKPFFTRTIVPLKYWILILILVAGGLVYFAGIDLDVDEFIAWIRDFGPIPFFFALAILPAVGFPTTPFFFVAGAAFGVWISIVGSVVAQAINLVFCYWLSTRYLRAFLEKMISKTKYTIPQVRKENFIKVTLLIKIAPGPPNFLKTYILGLAGIPFGIFFIISLPTSVGYGIGIIVVGDSLLDGNTGQAIVGVSILVVLMIGIKMLRDHLLRRKGRLKQQEGDEPEVRSDA